jgi:twitching motility two-component system response regulator PilH
LTGASVTIEGNGKIMARILIVDDSATQTLNVSRIIKKHGHQVMTAQDGAEGVERAKAELPDLILMDVVMPNLNGFQATRKLSLEPTTKHIPVVLVTTKDQDTDKIWGQRQGARAYVTKPVDEELLVSTVNDLLASSN